MNTELIWHVHNDIKGSGKIEKLSIEKPKQQISQIEKLNVYETVW